MHNSIMVFPLMYRQLNKWLSSLFKKQHSQIIISEYYGDYQCSLHRNCDYYLKLSRCMYEIITTVALHSLTAGPSCRFSVWVDTWWTVVKSPSHQTSEYQPNPGWVCTLRVNFGYCFGGMFLTTVKASTVLYVFTGSLVEI